MIKAYIIKIVASKRSRKTEREKNSKKQKKRNTDKSLIYFSRSFGCSSLFIIQFKFELISLIRIKLNKLVVQIPFINIQIQTLK
jgi:hypothetical protein